MKKSMGIGCMVLALSLVLGSAATIQTEAKKKNMYLSKTSLSLYVGKTAKLKVKNTKKKVKWSSSKKKVASVNKKGKVTAKKVGKATITAKVAGKKLKCKVTVKKKITYKTVMVENFENYEAGTDWGNYTLGEGLTSGGDEDPHYLREGETMKVVVDPENTKNKVLEVKPKFYSFAPVFTVDLAKLTGVSEKKLGDYAGVRVKIRVISDAGCHVGIGLNAFFGAAGTIDKRYAFNTYTTADTALPSEVEYYKFYYAKGMLSGVTADDALMPQFRNGKHMKGHAFAPESRKTGFATKTLTFNKYLTGDLKALTSFDFVLGGSYSTPTDGDLVWYMDDVQLIYK